MLHSVSKTELVVTQIPISSMEYIQKASLFQLEVDGPSVDITQIQMVMEHNTLINMVSQQHIGIKQFPVLPFTLIGGN